MSVNDLNKAKELLRQIEALIDSHIEFMGGVAKNEGGVTTTSSMASQLGTASAKVILTDGISEKKKRKKLEKKTKAEVLRAPDDDTSGVITTINGKRLKLTGLSDKEKDKYLFGDTEVRKAASYVDIVSEYLEAISSPELEDDFEGSLMKCDLSKTSKLIKGKNGVWRRIKGKACFICPDGVIHAGPKAFVGKKVATLRDELRAEREAAKK